jgi:hypothetical protein
MFLVLAGAAPIAQNEILQPVDENENGIKHVETETECCANDGAIAETIPKEEQLDSVLYS